MHMGQAQWNFSGKRALVTGGSRGIGRAIVRLLTDAGAHVTFTYASREDEALRLVDACRQAENGGKAEAVRCDLTEASDIARLTERLTSPDAPPLHYLVNNAGITADAPVYLMTDKQWRDVLEVDLHALFTLSQSLLRPLALSRGAILNVASVTGLSGAAGQINYASAKAGVIGFTKALSKEVGALGVRVNCIAPGYTETGMLDALTDERRRKLQADIALRRFAAPEEIAQAAAFLLSDAASYVTGEVLVISGGLI